MDSVYDMKNQTNVLNRFTSLQALYSMVEGGKLNFSDPRWWPDRNDSKLLDLYCKKKDISIRILCLAGDYETISFWTDYADNGNGCCIQFDRKNLLEKLDTLVQADPDVRHRKTMYLKFKEIKRFKKLQLDDIPFCKRWPYRYESEYRIIKEFAGYGKADISASINICIRTDIEKITLGPNIDDESFKEIREDLLKRGIKKVNRSTVLKSNTWFKKFSHLL
jgi:GTPase SAR1 family protein